MLGALDAEPLVLHAFPEAEIKVFERILPLEFVGERSLRGLTPGTVVVAFSRKAVLALAGEINRLHPGRVSVLYGAMPLSSRREEIDRFLERHAPTSPWPRTCSATASTCPARRCSSPRRRSSTASRGATCCRGSSRRSRAARGASASSSAGTSASLTGVPWASADPAIVEEALQPHVVLPSGHLGYRIVDEARIRPRLSDLGVDDPRRLDAALAAWHRVATRAWAYESWLAVESLSPIRGRLAAIQRRLVERNRRLSIEDTWKLINAPVDEDNAELLATLALAVVGRHGAAIAAHVPARPGAAARLRRSRKQSKLEEPQVSCAGSRCSTPASAASRSSVPPRSRRRPRRASWRACGSR